GRELGVQLVEAFSPNLPAVAISKSDAHLISRFLWNIGACHVTWLGKQSVTLKEIWDVTTQTLIFGRFKSLLKMMRSDEDRLEISVLAGTLTYFAPEEKDRIATMLEGSIFGFRRLIERSEEMSFIPAALATIGLSLFGPPHVAFARPRVSRLVSKAPEYSQRGPAVGQLANYLWRVSGSVSYPSGKDK
ncbi:MAG: hypothetical protein Q8L22_10250, partial [Reyranella sp.]|nr:hypothetical protein [Reyranella sp.]